MARDANVRFASSELNRLIEYEWPGNVRELRNVIERALIIQRGQTLRPSQLLRIVSNSPSFISDNCVNTEGEVVTLDAMEKQCIEQALDKYKNNFSQTAKALGISLSTLKRKVKIYNLTYSNLIA
jgi:DNA-binding NtrC family response regulator